MTAGEETADLADADLVSFADPAAEAEPAAAQAWRILIVDDEPDVHRATTLALSGLTMLGRSLQFLHAYGADEAARLLREEPEIAVALLDVVMEREDDGLRLVRAIRDDLRLADLRIILRTGQPGYAPELQTIHDYDINDYRTKSELTRTRLYASLMAALRAYTQIRALDRLAFYDRLSALPNRNRFIQLVDERIAAGRRDETTIAILDVDDFAEVNDALGHQQGDRLLQAVAERLTSQLSAGAVIARIGGDTFGLMADPGALTPEHLLALLRQPLRMPGGDMSVTATVGLVALHDVSGGGQEALKDANIALKRAKRERRGGCVRFSAEMGHEIRERVRLLQGLRRAVDSERLFVVYQPQVRLSDRSVVGVEALIRWRTDEGEYIAPDRFIPLAEASGLIVSIGEWVLRTACLEAVRLHAAGHPELRMSVNVSRIQFDQPNFLDMLRDAIRDTRITPRLLELEITESVMMGDPDLMRERLARVRELGVSVAMDDFGTGYSSLSQLRLLPAERLKIDRAFVRPIEAGCADQGLQIAALVVELGKSLRMAVIAEGVELESQAQALLALGCDEGQGYLFARPMGPGELLAWLGRGP